MVRKNRTWKKVERTDRFTLCLALAEPRTFSVRLRQGPGKCWSLTFVASNVDVALREAPFVAGLETRTVREGVGITLNEAFVAALDHTRRRPRSRRDWESSVVRFAKWLARNHHECA